MLAEEILWGSQMALMQTDVNVNYHKVCCLVFKGNAAPEHE